MKRSRRPRRRGFTLLEVMLVVGILAMLAVFVVPQFMGQDQKAKVKATQAMVGPSGPIATAIALFHQEYGRFPEQLKDLVEMPDDIDDETTWSPFMATSEFNDSWNNELVYKAPGDVQEDGYDLLSFGPDGDEGSDDDITNYKKDD
jgi:general secretion pathway protein G